MARMKNILLPLVFLFMCPAAFSQAPEAPTGLTASLSITETTCPATMPFTCSLFFPSGNVEPFVLSWYGGSVPVGTYKLTRGALPPGIVLDSDGLLHGTLDVAGQFECGFTITAADGTVKEFPIVFKVF